MDIRKWLSCHECVRRALRTFLQAAVGVAVAAVISAAGVVSKIDVSAVIALAVATGLATVMNRGSGLTGGDKEDTKDDGSNADGSDEDGV